MKLPTEIDIQFRPKKSLKIEITWSGIKTTIAILIFTSFFYVAPKLKDAAFNKWRYQKQAQELVTKFHERIIECGKSNCINARANFFVTPFSEGIRIDLYNMDDNITAQLMKICVDEYFLYGQKIHIAIKIHYQSKVDSIHAPFWKHEDVTTVNMEMKK